VRTLHTNRCNSWWAKSRRERLASWAEQNSFWAIVEVDSRHSQSMLGPISEGVRDTEGVTALNYCEVPLKAKPVKRTQPVSLSSRHHRRRILVRLTGIFPLCHLIASITRRFQDNVTKKRAQYWVERRRNVLNDHYMQSSSVAAKVDKIICTRCAAVYNSAKRFQEEPKTSTADEWNRQVVVPSP
jgi:hypothetical protein